MRRVAGSIARRPRWDVFGSGRRLRQPAGRSSPGIVVAVTSRSSPHRLARTGFVQGVRTFDRPEMDAACRELQRLVVAEFQPDVIIGIRTGGLVVATQLAADAWVICPFSRSRPVDRAPA